MDNEQEFWEWCGFVKKREFGSGMNYWFYPSYGTTLWVENYDSNIPLELSLDNLFKYAVPKFEKDLLNIVFTYDYTEPKIKVVEIFLNSDNGIHQGEGNTYKLALYEAINKVRLDG